MAVEHDEIGIWSEVKLAIIKKYAAAYTTIMDAQRRASLPRLRWLYIDRYAGSGHHISKITGETVEGSPLIALNTIPPFHEYHFIDADTGRAGELRKERETGRTYSPIATIATPFFSGTSFLGRSGTITNEPCAFSIRTISTSHGK